MKRLFVFVILCLVSYSFIKAQNDKETSRGENFIKQIQGKLDKAKEQVDKSCLDPEGSKNAENWYLKSYVYSQLAKSQVYKKLAPNAEFEALDAVKKSKELDTQKKFESDRINVLFELSTIFYNKGITLYNDAVENNKEAEFPVALNNFEKFLETIDVLGGDQVIVTNLLQYNKVNLNSIYLYAGYAAQKSGQTDKAKSFYQKLVLLNVSAEQAKQTGNPLAYIYYIDLLLSTNDTLAARGVAEKGLEVYPENPDVVMAAIDLFSKMKKMSEMADLMEKVVQQNTNPDVKMVFVLGQAYNNIAKEFARKGYQSTAEQYRTKAIAYFEKVLQSNPTDKKVLFNSNYNLGVIYYNAAVIAFKQRDETNTTEFEFLFKKSLPYLEKAHELDPKSKNVMNMLLKAYTSLNEKAKADAIESELYK
jgi:tetratricopeptide (TPR) repeat protein